jgi:hypothetical protein
MIPVRTKSKITKGEYEQLKISSSLWHVNIGISLKTWNVAYNLF